MHVISAFWVLDKIWTRTCSCTRFRTTTYDSFHNPGDNSALYKKCSEGNSQELTTKLVDEVTCRDHNMFSLISDKTSRLFVSWIGERRRMQTVYVELALTPPPPPPPPSSASVIAGSVWRMARFKDVLHPHQRWLDLRGTREVLRRARLAYLRLAGRRHHLLRNHCRWGRRWVISYNHQTDLNNVDLNTRELEDFFFFFYCGITLM